MSIYELPKLQVIELTLGKIAVIVLTLVFAFILPISTITLYQKDPLVFQKIFQKQQQTGQVAGVSTNAEVLQGSLNPESSLLIMVGLVLVGISIILIIFLIIDNHNYRKKRY